MAKLDQILHALSSTESLHALAAKRWRQKHDLAHSLRDKAIATETEAEKARKAGKQEHAHELDLQALDLRAQAQAAHRGAIVQIHKARRLKKKIAGLEKTAAELKAAAQKHRNDHGLKVQGNYIKGDAPGGVKFMAAWHAAGARCAAGSRRNVYSMGGPFFADKFILGEPTGARSDCSQAYIAAAHSAEIKSSPSGSWTEGFTGSIADHGKRITRAAARSHPGAAVEWGSYPYHHIEAAEGDDTENTWGHGSPPIDRGTFDLLGPADAFYALPGI